MMGELSDRYVLWFQEIGIEHIPLVGGKNASLGEMIHHFKKKKINIPDGFATTSVAYWRFIEENELREPIEMLLQEFKMGKLNLSDVGEKIRTLILKSTLPIPLAENITAYYHKLEEEYNSEHISVAVRSSATAEDLPHASFAGLQETYLNISTSGELIEACKKCYASLFTNRAISYREEKGFEHMKVALSVGVQKMVRADNSCSGVMFTVDTETGFPDAIIINGAWGLGENVVKGTINPDQFTVFKPFLSDRKKHPVIEKKVGSKEIKMVFDEEGGNRTKNISTSGTERKQLVLNDNEILKLSRWGVIIEEHYKAPMDIEWVKEDETGKLFIVQARPETVQSQASKELFTSYTITEKNRTVLIKGLSIGHRIVHGVVKMIKSPDDLEDIESNHILVTKMTEPDWVPSLRKAAGIITDFGGRTCHAAIVSRELGISAVVGTMNATKVLREGDKITLSSGEGDQGIVYRGYVDFNIQEVNLDKLPSIDTNIMLNLATPESAFKWWKLPVNGIGLARMEFIITNHIRIHPMALAHPERVENEQEFESIRKLTKGFQSYEEYFVDKLSMGIAKIAASQYPNQVIVRTSDFKTNEYERLIGGKGFEPHEENPMLGWRGAARYYSDGYRDGFKLECKALKKVREEIGFDNVVIMIPFCRTIKEADLVQQELAKNGLTRGEHGLEVYVMCEIPSNYILVEEFSEYFDGFSIGSNDLTQLILGVDRDSAELAYLFDENDPAVKKAIQSVIERAHRQNRKVGFCGQAPSDDPDFAAFLVDNHIDSISLNPDSVISTIEKLVSTEQKIPA